VEYDNAYSARKNESQFEGTSQKLILHGNDEEEKQEQSAFAPAIES